MTHEERLQVEESRLLTAIKTATDSDAITKVERYNLLSGYYAELLAIAQTQAEQQPEQQANDWREAAIAHQKRMASGAYIHDDNEFWSCALSGVKGL